MKKEIPTFLIIVCCIIYGAISYGLIMWLNALGLTISAVGLHLICNILEDRGF